MKNDTDRPIATHRRQLGLKRRGLLASATLAPIASIFRVARAAEVLKFGMSVPMSGGAANWGIGCEWVGKQAAAQINGQGGIKVSGKSYTVEIIAYDNKYNTAEGAKVAQTLINRDGVKFIVQAIGTAPVKATQALSERAGVLLFTTAWAKDVKGPSFPLTFTNTATPTEFLAPLFEVVKQANPTAKTVSFLNPNDAAGQESARESAVRWAALGITPTNSLSYERGTSEFQPIVTKITQSNPDIVDLGATPPADIGLILKELAAQGWNGVKVASAGSGADAMVKTGGAAVEGVYMPVAADFSGAAATPIQRRLDADGKKALGEPLSLPQMGVWDTMMALKAAIEKANSLDPRVVAKVLPDIVFESSYGATVFGGSEVYGSPQQMLIPIIVTQIRNGGVVEVKRVSSPELERRLAKS